MGKLVMGAEGYGGPTILVVAPHADDETLGCGGLIAKSDVPIEVVIFGVTGIKRFAELDAAMEALRVIRWTILYPDMDGLLDQIAMQKMVTDIDVIIRESKPQEIYYCPPQHHQDHRIVAQVMAAALRPWGGEYCPDLIATYELPGRYDFQTAVGGDMYVPLAKDHIDKKIEALTCYGSQVKQWGVISPSNVSALAKVRGAECRAGHAERFKVIMIRR